MSDDDQLSSGWWMKPLADLVGGRRVITVGGPAAYWTAQVEALRAAGAADILVYGTEGAGVGPQPDARIVAVERHAGPMMAAVRHAVEAAAHPPAEVAAAIAAFDPDGDAVVFGSFLNEAPHLEGRKVVAYRRPAWVRLEDKTLVDAVLDRAGVARAPSAVVPVATAAARWRDLDAGDGVVLAGDSRDGYHGGAALVRWVVDDATLATALTALAPACDTVRVMPFVDGIPCSIHGVVLPGGVAAFRPVEMLTLRRGHELIYSGCATFWDPAPGVREAMRDAARRVGEALRGEVGFRGAFTLDGVDDGSRFWPTEINPRLGGGLTTMMRGLGAVPLSLVLDLVVAGRLTIDASALEERVVPAADASRAGATMHGIDQPIAAFDHRPVSFDGSQWAWSPAGDPADGLVGCTGSFVRLEFDGTRTPNGSSAGGRAAQFFAFCDRLLGTAFGDLRAAPQR